MNKTRVIVTIFRSRLIHILIFSFTFHIWVTSYVVVKVENSPQGADLRWKQAIQIETQMSTSLESYLLYLRDIPSIVEHGNYHESSSIRFPSVRQCNEALATFGDSGDLIRALRLFGSMRKATLSTWTAYKDYASSSSSFSSNRIRSNVVVPYPTLVTYSTLMSRAVSLGKARVALRLWRLMMMQNELYGGMIPVSSTSHTHNTTNTTMIHLFDPIVPDIRAVNILMNSYAKLADVTNAWLLMNQLFFHQNEDHYENNNNNNNNHTMNNPWIPTLSSKYTGVSNINHNSAYSMDTFAYELIRIIPPMQPNTITYNSLIDACHRAGDLDRGMFVESFMVYNTPFCTIV